MRKKSFLLYIDYAKHINRLSDEEAGQLLKALFQYTEDKTDPRFDGALGMAFSFIAEQISRDSEKYEKICQRRAQSGRLGGLSTQAGKRKQVVANEAENDKETENVTESGIDTVNDTGNAGESTLFSGIFSKSMRADKK